MRAMSSRSGGNATTKASGPVVANEANNGGSNNKHPNQQNHQIIRVKLAGNGRTRTGAGSVEAHKQRDKSLAGGSTQQSTPEKSEDFELTLFSEIHRNLVALDKAKPSPLDTHNISKEYRTKMVDWMVEVTTSFKCTIRTYFLAVAIFD